MLHTQQHITSACLSRQNFALPQSDLLSCFTQIFCSIAWPQFGDNDSGELLWVGQMRILLHHWVDYISRKDVTKVSICLILVVWDDVALLVFTCWRHLPWRVPDLLHLFRHAAHHHPLATRHQAVAQRIRMITEGFVPTGQRVPARVLLSTQRGSPLSHWVAVVQPRVRYAIHASHAQRARRLRRQRREDSLRERVVPGTARPGSHCHVLDVRCQVRPRLLARCLFGLLRSVALDSSQRLVAKAVGKGLHPRLCGGLLLSLHALLQATVHRAWVEVPVGREWIAVGMTEAGLRAVTGIPLVYTMLVLHATETVNVMHAAHAHIGKVTVQWIIAMVTNRVILGELFIVCNRSAMTISY